MRKRAIVGAFIVGVVIGVGRAGADESPPAWPGPWLVEGTCSWRHVGRLGDGLILEGRVGRADVRLTGRPGRHGFVLRGTVIEDDDGVTRAARLRAEADATGLDVTLDVAGRPRRTERWVRPRAPTLRLDVPGGPSSPDAPPPDGARVVRLAAPRPLRVVVHVEGRPQVVVLSVLAPDDPRYAHLGGVVHHEVLGGGAPLPVGRYVVEWGVRDRSLAEEPLLPGEYRLVVEAGDGLVGPPPGREERPARAEVRLVLGDPGPPAQPEPETPTVARAPTTSEPAPSAGLAHGLSRR